ncbi:MAG: YqhA family protein [Anaerolineae bacterium]|nr:YqhA family protein [Anaerolineae bacterium]
MLLWNSRWLIVVPVIISLILSISVLIVTTVDALDIVGQTLTYLGASEEARSSLFVQTISEVVAIVDGYLLATIMLIFALGLYELFVSKIQVAEGSEFAERLLLIRSLDDLKNRLANVILVILIVKFFQQALNQKYTTAADGLYLALGVVLIAGALYLSGRAKPAKEYESSKAAEK